MILRNGKRCDGKHYLSNEPLTDIGLVVEYLNRPDCFSRENFIKDRGQRIDQINDILSFPEFKKYYVGSNSFKARIRTIMREDDGNDWGVNFAFAFTNEVMYRLMKDHGVSYEAAINLVPNSIFTNGVDDFINLDDSINYTYRIFKDFYPEAHYYFYAVLIYLCTTVRELANYENFHFH